MQSQVGLSRLITAALRDGFLLFDGSGRVIDANRAFCRMTGYTRSEVVGAAPPYPFVAATGAAGRTPDFAGADGADIHLTLRRKDGSLLPVAVTTSPADDGDDDEDGIGDGTGNGDGTGTGPASHFALFRDARQSEAAPAEPAPGHHRLPRGVGDGDGDGDGHLAAIIQNAPSQVFIKDADGRYLLVNEPFERAAGIEPGSLIGKTDEHVFPPDVAAAFRAEDRQIIESRRPRTYEESFSYNGEDLTFVTTKFPLFDAAGRVYAVCGIATDVTALRRAEHVVAESEQRLRALFEQTAAGIAQLDPAGRFVMVNQWFCDFVGYSRDELLNLRVQDVTHPDDLGRSLDLLEKAKAGRSGDGYRLEKRYLRKDGSVVWASVSSSVLRDPDGGVKAVLGVVTDITDRVRTEEARRMSEFRFKRLVEQSPLSTQLFAPDGTIRQVNGAWEKLFGVTLADLPDYNILNDPQLAGAGILPLVRRAFAGEAVTIDPVPYVPDRGEYKDQVRWCGAYIYPVKDDAGRVEEVVLLHNDVTELKRAEEGLRAATERWQLAITATQDGIWDWTLQPESLYWSPRCKQMLGYADDELPVTRDAVRDLMHPDDRPRAWAETVRHLEGHTDLFQCEYRLQHKDGSYRWVLARGVAMRDAGGKAARMIGSHTDVTERKRSEQALREAEERLRLGLRAGKTGTWDWDIAANRVVWSDQLYEFHGLRPGEFGGTAQEFEHLVHPDDRPRVDAAMRAALAGERPYELEFRTVLPNGDVRWLSTAGQVLFGDNHRPVRMLGATNDITDRKRLEEERTHLLEAERKARAEAEAASEAKDRFLAVLSHELRTPLTPVLATVEVLSNDPQLPPQFAEDVRVIRRNVELEARLIDDIIDVTRIARGKVQLHHEALDAHASIHHALQICQREIESKQLELVLALGAGRRHVWADPTRFQQVLWNLVNNAVKFTPARGRVTVRTADGDDGRLLIEVSDTGIGIAPETLPRLFNAFEQGERAVTRRYGGLGLGLTITKALVEMHGGTIDAASAGRDRGATFSLRFATVPDPSAARADAPGAGAAGAAAPSLRILLVEDNPDTLRVMARVLKTFGYAVETATGVKAALDLAGRQRFDLLVSDIGLPDGTGWDVMRELNRTQSIRGIALSGYGLDDDLRRSREAGFAQHLTKPVSFQALRDVIRQVVPEVSSGA